MSAISSKLLFSVVMDSSKANVYKRKLWFKNTYANKAKHIKRTQMRVRKSYNSPLGYFELIFRPLSFISPCGCAVVDPMLFHCFIPCYLEGILPANTHITVFSMPRLASCPVTISQTTKHILHEQLKVYRVSFL